MLASPTTVPSASETPDTVSRIEEGRRARVARFLDSLGVLDRFLWFKGKLGAPRLAVLTYHRIAPLSAIGDLDLDVIEAEPHHLAEQLGIIRTHCTALTMADVIRFVRGSGTLPPNPVLIAFDDGYAECHDVVLPMLQRFGMPATFFIPTAFPDSGRLFWWDRVALVIRRSQLPALELDYPVRLRLELGRDRRVPTRLFCRAIKRTLNVDVDRALAELERAAGVAVGAAEERALAARTTLTWSQVRALRRAGMDVQSHSHSHRVLDTLPPAEAERDLRRSREVLAEVLGEPVRTVAYPVGYRLRGPFRDASQAAGFELGFTNNTGLCPRAHFDPLNIPRLAMAREHAGALYKLLLLMGERPDRWAAA